MKPLNAKSLEHLIKTAAHYNCNFILDVTSQGIMVTAKKASNPQMAPGLACVSGKVELVVWVDKNERQPDHLTEHMFQKLP